MIITTNPKNYLDADLQEVATRHDDAASATSTLTRALDMIPLLSAEVARLRACLARTLTNLHNLTAAARATLRATADGEDDPLFYLRDELEAQGQLPPWDRERP